jgi:hypothetical protein
MNMRGAVALNRPVPKLGPQAYKSYSWRQPLQTHFRRVTCADVRCAEYVNGWVTVVDTATELGQRQYDYLSRDRTRSPHAEKTGTSLVSFTYPPGSQPFDSTRHEHYRPIGYEPVTVVHGGDFRGNPRRDPPRIMRPQDWVDDFANHQERLARAQR